MRSSIFVRAIFCLAPFVALMMVAAARADDDQNDDALPSVQALSCVPSCANATRAVAIDKSAPPYPLSFRDARAPVEGYVRLQYVVAADGTVGDVAVLQLVGPRDFADRTIASIKRWTYKPGTLDGKPVAQGFTVSEVFGLRNLPENTMQPAVFRAYKSAQDFLAAGKDDEAYSDLADQIALPHMDFYERGMMAYLMAQIALKKDDYPGARHLVELSTDHDTAKLPAPLVLSMWRMRLEADLLMGDMVDALQSVGSLKAAKGFDPADPLIALLSAQRAKLDATPQVFLTAKIPPAADGDGFYFGLYRRAFSFQVTSGSLDKFTLSCRQQVIESQITPTAMWHVPRDWNSCFVLVRGAPGTNFRVVQTSE